LKFQHFFEILTIFKYEYFPNLENFSNLFFFKGSEHFENQIFFENKQSRKIEKKETRYLGHTHPTPGGAVVGNHRPCWHISFGSKQTNS
jgi:hypothetical protein